MAAISANENPQKTFGSTTSDKRGSTGNRSLSLLQIALYPRSVGLITTAFHDFKCHPLARMSLKLHLCADPTRTRFRQFTQVT